MPLPPTASAATSFAATLVTSWPMLLDFPITRGQAGATIIGSTATWSFGGQCAGTAGNSVRQELARCCSAGVVARCGGIKKARPGAFKVNRHAHTHTIVYLFRL